MKSIERKIASLLAGTGVIPVPKECLEDILKEKHVVFNEESEEGESEEVFMRRAFCKALQTKSIANSTKQCMVINTPVGHGKMSIGEIEQLSSYIRNWSTGNTPHTMNWGLYEIPNSSSMRITIVANMERNISRTTCVATVALLAVLAVTFGCHFLFGNNGYLQKQKEAEWEEYSERRIIWRNSEAMTMQGMLRDLTLLANGDSVLVCESCFLTLPVYRDFIHGTAQPKRSAWVNMRHWYGIYLMKGKEEMQRNAKKRNCKSIVFWSESRTDVQDDSLNDYRKEPRCHTEIEYDKVYPKLGRPADKEYKEWREGHKTFHFL